MQLGKTGQADQITAVAAPRTTRAKATTPAAPPTTPDQFDAGLEHPTEEVARHRRPVIVIHGTIVHKDSIEAYRDFALAEGHPVDLRNYPTITDGAPIQESAQLVSQNINQARSALAKENLAYLQGASTKEQVKFFNIDGNLYGKTDPNAAKVSAQVPWLMDAVGSVLQQSDSTLTNEFSSRMSQVEGQLADRLANTPGWSPETREKVASELVDSLAPKATLVGHSAGGFVAYTVAVNPSEPGKAHDEFSYDGGNGVANVVLLSSPVGKGLSEPLPPAMADMGFYQMDQAVLKPLEQLPLSQLMMQNPMTALSYNLMKGATKVAWGVASQMTTAMSLPLIYAQKPGYQQVTGSSQFFKEYLKDKAIPDGVSVTAVTSPDDHMSLPSRSQVNEKQTNAHNFTADLEMAPGEVERERPSWGHVKMSTMPAEFQAQFSQSLIDNPEHTVNYLNPSNDDGSRFDVLTLLGQQLKKNPSLLDSESFAPVKTAMQSVAAEKLPFSDSPSALAQQLLNPKG